MALFVKHPKTCRNKKQSAAFLTPPDSPLSSSSGSLSSGNSERKKPLKIKIPRNVGLAIFAPKQKKFKAKKSSSPSVTASGSDSDCLQQHKSSNSLDEMIRNALYSLCKAYFFLYLNFC